MCSPPRARFCSPPPAARPLRSHALAPPTTPRWNGTGHAPRGTAPDARGAEKRAACACRGAAPDARSAELPPTRVAWNQPAPQLSNAPVPRAPLLRTLPLVLAAVAATRTAWVDREAALEVGPVEPKDPVPSAEGWLTTEQVARDAGEAADIETIAVAEALPSDLGFFPRLCGTGDDEHRRAHPYSPRLEIVEEAARRLFGAYDKERLERLGRHEHPNVRFVFAPWRAYGPLDDAFFRAVQDTAVVTLDGGRGSETSDHEVGGQAVRGLCWRLWQVDAVTRAELLNSALRLNGTDARELLLCARSLTSSRLKGVEPLLAHEDPDVVVDVVSWLWVRWEDRVPVRAALLADPRPQVRAAVAGASQWWGVDDPLHARMLADPDADVRAAALGAWRDDSPLPRPLVTFLTDASPLVRGAALRNPRAGAAEISVALGDADAEVRRAALERLSDRQLRQPALMAAARRVVRRDVDAFEREEILDTWRRGE